MEKTKFRIMFDREDYSLLKIVNDILNNRRSPSHFQKLLKPNLHPRGIKELAASKDLRIAYSVIHILNSLSSDDLDVRLRALRAIHSEVLSCSHSALRINTARVLLQIMKELVRSEENSRRQLELAHDFRQALTGRPRLIRKQLSNYHLLEMPEEWNQIAFDDHVHDANTKGRKTPSHLIMDAWIKGIRSLTVVYYNFVTPQAVHELLSAADIMGIEIRIGIEFRTIFHEKHADFIWVPKGFLRPEEFCEFLLKPEIVSFMLKGEEISKFKSERILQVLDIFNSSKRLEINKQFNVHLSELDKDEYNTFVGTGQSSLVHLSEFIAYKLEPVLERSFKVLRVEHLKADDERKRQIADCISAMNDIDSEVIENNILEPIYKSLPEPEPESVPELMRLTPRDLITELKRLPSSFSLTLNLDGLLIEDIPELIFETQGKTSSIEIMNLKDCAKDSNYNTIEINRLRQAINTGNIISLKRIVHGIIQKVNDHHIPHHAARIEMLRKCLLNLKEIQGWYEFSPLGARIGSDSTSRSRRLHGMGLVAIETLPKSAQKEILNTQGSIRSILPIKSSEILQKKYYPDEYPSVVVKFFSKFSFLHNLACHRKYEWELLDKSYNMGIEGNLATLGGFKEDKSDRFVLEEESKIEKVNYPWAYMNNTLKSTLKVALGFIPAFMAFYFTKNWWVLAYLGAFIWFGITGLRNILQSVLGGGGIRYSSLLSWGDFVSWQRVADSLLYTGISVPLLDYLVKQVILEHGFGITVSSNAVAVYGIMGLVNGCYIAGHNVFRGLPKGAVLGNAFRAILSVPLAIIFNIFVGGVLSVLGVAAPGAVLQKWAAIISKTASDCVAGIIEGAADRMSNINLRQRDYKAKIKQFFSVYEALELHFPESDLLQMLNKPKKLLRQIKKEAEEIQTVLIINALDLQYFWFYQPRARDVFRKLLENLTQEEQMILLHSQNILGRNKEISQLFVDGLVGKNFSKALSFYLDNFEEYIDDMKSLSPYLLNNKE